MYQNVTTSSPGASQIHVYVSWRHSAVAQSVERPSKGPGSRGKSSDVGSKHANAAAKGGRKKS